MSPRQFTTVLLVVATACGGSNGGKDGTTPGTAAGTPSGPTAGIPGGTPTGPVAGTPTGTPCPDADGDGVCDDADACPGSDDALDADTDGVPDDCDRCPEGPPDKLTLPVGLQPADLVIVVDNSGSMALEVEMVRGAVNSLSSRLFLANIDLRLALISAGSDDPQGICVPPPVGSGSCPADENPPGYLHIHDGVGSNNALQKILTHHATWSALQRQWASKHLLVVSDDDSDLTASSFDSQLTTLDPTMVGYRFHAIASPEDPVIACVAGTSCCPNHIPLSADLSQEYIDLVALTGGLFDNLCDQDFGPFFDQLVAEVVNGSAARCDFELPSPPVGRDPADLNAEIRDGAGGILQVGAVASVADCTGVDQGWYADDPLAPTTLHLCPQTCADVRGFPAPELDLFYGCEPIDAATAPPALLGCDTRYCVLASGAGSHGGDLCTCTIPAANQPTADQVQPTCAPGATADLLVGLDLGPGDYASWTLDTCQLTPGDSAVAAFEAHPLVQSSEIACDASAGASGCAQLEANAGGTPGPVAATPTGTAWLVVDESAAGAWWDGTTARSFEVELIPRPVESSCDDGLDNDGDALFDCDDPDCIGSAVCLYCSDVQANPICTAADPALCVCLGCVDDGVCDLTEDCVCSDCSSQATCTNGCNHDAICNPYEEACSCPDCAAHPECLAP